MRQKLANLVFCASGRRYVSGFAESPTKPKLELIFKARFDGLDFRPEARVQPVGISAHRVSAGVFRASVSAVRSA